MEMALQSIVDSLVEEPGEPSDGQGNGRTGEIGRPSVTETKGSQGLGCYRKIEGSLSRHVGGGLVSGNWQGKMGHIGRFSMLD
jgi:hypothetical protein